MGRGAVPFRVSAADVKCFGILEFWNCIFGYGRYVGNPAMTADDQDKRTDRNRTEVGGDRQWMLIDVKFGLDTQVGSAMMRQRG